MTRRRTFFIPLLPMDAYREWKAYRGMAPSQPDSPLQLIDDIPNRSVTWSRRYGLAQVYGRADFIPVQGGCVVSLAITGATSLTRLLLWLPFERYVWRTAERFVPLTQGFAEAA